MALKRPERRKRTAVSLPTTQMIDTLFILLIFFIVVSQVRESNAKVNLPKVDKAQGKSDAKDPRGSGAALVVSIAADGKLHLDHDRLAGISELRSRLEARKRDAAVGVPGRVVLRADREAKSGLTVQVVHLLAELGFERMQFDVLPEEAGGQAARRGP